MFWLIIMIFTWLFLVGWARIVTGHVSPTEVAMTLVGRTVADAIDPGDTRIVIVRVDEPDDSLIDLAQDRPRSISALEQKWRNTRGERRARPTI
jgi:hypothetical protein